MKCQKDTKGEPLGLTVTSLSSMSGSGSRLVNSSEAKEKVGGPEKELVVSGVEGRAVNSSFSEYTPEKKNTESSQRSVETKIDDLDCESEGCGVSNVNSLELNGNLEIVMNIESGNTIIPYDTLNENELSESDDEELCPVDDEEINNAMHSGRYWYVVRDIICKHQRLGNKCPCMYAFKIKKNVYYFDEPSLNDILAINMECRLNIIAKSQNRDNIARYRFHKLVIIALTTKDKNLVCDARMPRGEFLSAIYELRQHYEIFSDFGQKNQIVKPTPHGQGFGDKIIDIIKSIGDSVWSFVCKGTKTIGDLVGESLKMILGKLKDLIGLVSETLANALDNVVDKIKTALIRSINVRDFIPDIFKQHESSKLIVICCVLLVLVVVDVLGILAYRLATRVVDNLIRYYSEKDGFVGEGPEPNMFAGIISLCGLVLGLTVTDLTTLSKRAREITSLVTAGLSGSFLLSSLFIILPVTVQSALKIKFGTAETKEKLLLEEWIVKSNAVNRLRKVPKVLISDEYFNWCNDLHKEAIKMKGLIKVPANAHVFLKNYVTLVETLTVLENYRNSKSSRNYPYSLHLSAPPGYGKTLLVNKLCQDLFGVISREIYTRPVASEFWDGYMDQKIVIMDEFLIGESTDKVRIAKEYLELVSTKAFIPNLASVDNPSVGIKGTQAEPIGVVTINNMPYQKVSHVDNNALWRRREFVIQLKIAEEFKHVVQGSKIDLGSLTQEQIKERVWLVFDLLPAEPNRGQKIENLTYAQLIRALRDHYARFLETCELIRLGNEDEICLDKSPNELLEDMMRELRGVPNEPQSLTDAIFEFFGNINFFGQGPGEESKLLTIPSTSATADLIEKLATEEEESKQEQADVVSNDEISANINCKDVNKSNLWRPETGNPYRSVWNRAKRIKAKSKLSREKVLALFRQAHKDFLKIDKDEETIQYYLKAVCYVGESEEQRRERKQTDARVVLAYLNHLIMKYSIDTESVCSSDDYYSCEESDRKEFPVQKEINATIDHSNVDPTKIHRHKCLGYYFEPVYNSAGGRMRDSCQDMQPATKLVNCQYSFAHKHESGIVHSFLCSDCKRRGHKQQYDAIHGSCFPDQMQKRPDLIPDDYEWEYQDGDPKYREELDKMWLDIYVDKFLSYGRTPIILLDDPEEGVFSSVRSPQQQFYTSLKFASFWCAIFVVIHGIKRVFSKDKESEEEICFGQSAPPAKQSGNSRSSRSYSRQTDDSNAHGQSGNQLLFYIDGVALNAIPIKGRTFMTYSHAFLREDGSLYPQGTSLKIRWNGVVETTTLNYDNMLRSNDGDDLVFYTHTCLKLPQFPDQVKKFWTIEEMEGFNSTQALLQIDGVPCYANAHLRKNKSYRYLNKLYVMNECLMYKFPTKRGDCGVPVISVGQNFPNKIMGMHIAGGSDGRDSYGLAIIVTKEDVLAALQPPRIEEPTCDFEACGPFPLEGPNLKSITYVPLSDQVTISRRTAISKSIISDDLMTKPKKHLPILSPCDVRAEGKDPLIEMLQDTLNVEAPVVDEELVETVKSSCLTHLKQKLRWPLGKRRLTFEEALQGVPGILASMRVKTSAGYPLIKLAKKRGKKDYFYFGPNGELFYEQFFRDMVEQYVERLEEEGIDERRFVAYLKDELVTKTKIEQKRARIIYCGDLVSNVAYRILFGHLLAAFNNSYLTTSSAVGLNQYSHDMHCMFDYLIEVGMNFVAGDFKNFDKRVQPQMQKAAYEILMELVDESITTPVAKDSFIIQQCKSPAQVLDMLVKFNCTHYSGCFFTTIVNNIVHELYLRFVFAKYCPTLVFEHHVRAKLCGDDHIYCFSDVCKDQMTPHKIRDAMSELGQVYTSDIKDQPLEDRFRRFDEITFLGAHPVLVEGQYSGALKKATIEETLHWTRNKNLTIRQECQTVLEMASLWDENYYMVLGQDINRALKNVGIDPIDIIGWRDMRRIVSSRTVVSGANFSYGFEGQGPPINSLAKLNADKEIISLPTNVRDPIKLAKKALNEESMDLNYGTDSRVYRTSFVWSMANITGKAIAHFDVPFGLLRYGDGDNLQNMPFDRFVYWNGDVELVFQLNATPFQQGVLVAYFVPLASYEVEIANITSCLHVMIQPDQSATYSLIIPFKYLRSLMNTIARTTESLGTVFVTPLSSLVGIDVDEVTITMYTSFPNSNFSIPRPVEGQQRPNKFYPVEGGDDIPEISSFEGPFEGQGNSVSSTTNYTFSNVGGDMPIQDIYTSNDQAATQDISPDVEMSMPFPLDNPPLCSGALPIEQSFPGMAASHGVRPTRDLQLKPAALSRQQMDFFNPAETKIETLCSKRCLLRKFSVSSSMPAGTELYKITLNTRMGIAEGENIPINLGVLNQFMFWKADIEFEFVSVQTQYHSVRLQSMCAYGAAGVSFGSRNVSYTNTIKFASDSEGTKYVFSDKIVFNQQTEFLRTYEGEDVVDPIQNYSLGTYAVYIANSLIAPPTVSQDIEILLFVRFHNVKVAVPRANSPFSWDDYLNYEPTPTWLMKGSERFNPNTIREFVYIGTTQINSRRSGVTFEGNQPPLGTYTIKNVQESGLLLVLRDSNLSNSLATGLETVDVTFNADNTITWDFTPRFQSIGWTPGNAVSLFEFRGNYLVLVAKETFTSEINFQAQGPSIESGTVTAEAIQEAETIPVTKVESQNRPNIPCKLEIGEKFEFCVSDVHEVLRRYIRMMPTDNVDLDQFVTRSFTKGTNSTTILNIPVQPQSHWRSLFAAWAGGTKYRIFSTEEGWFPQVFFNPYYNKDVNEPGIPIIDAINEVVFIYGNVSIQSNSAITGPLAREVSYPISSKSYIDVSAPFQTHLNFCYNAKTQDIAPISCGTLSLSYDAEVNAYPLIFTAAADDLRLGIFRPPKKTKFDMTVFVNGIGGFRNQNMMPRSAKNNDTLQVCGIRSFVENSRLPQRMSPKTFSKVTEGDEHTE